MNKILCALFCLLFVFACGGYEDASPNETAQVEQFAKGGGTGGTTDTKKTGKPQPVSTACTRTVAVNSDPYCAGWTPPYSTTGTLQPWGCEYTKLREVTCDVDWQDGYQDDYHCSSAQETLTPCTDSADCGGNACVAVPGTQPDGSSGHVGQCGRVPRPCLDGNCTVFLDAGRAASYACNY